MSVGAIWTKASGVILDRHVAMTSDITQRALTCRSGTAGAVPCPHGRGLKRLIRLHRSTYSRRAAPHQMMVGWHERLQ